jgi:phosphocarrier protein HPr
MDTGAVVMSISMGRAEIRNAEGFHLRPAARFVRLAQRYRAVVRISCGGGRADGKSILDLATLAAGCGSRLELEADGPDAAEAVAALVKLIEAGFYEESPQGLPGLEVENGQ